MRTVRLMAFLAALIGLSVSGCGDDDPGPPQSPSGTVVIDVTPDGIAASWELSGPGEFSATGSGDRTLSGLAIGEYTIVLNDA